MKTILHIIESLNVGGAEKSMIQNINGLTQYRHIVMTLHGPNTLNILLKKDVPVINLEVNSYLQMWRVANKVKQIITDNKVDLVHAQLFKSTIMGRLAKRSGIPFIFTLQSMLGEDLFKKNFIARKIERITYSRKEYIIAVSNAALDDYKKYILCNEQNAFVIYNSVEEKYFEESYKRFQPGNKVEMIAVGNLKALKNFDYLLDASRELPSELFHLDIFGDGPLRDHLQQRIINENLPVSLKGSVSNLHERFREYDLYLHCSKYEGSSLAIFEAMAKGLATAVSKLPVHIENTGGYGVYADLSNPSDLANKLKAVQAGEIEINENGEKGFRWVKTVAHPKIVLGKTAEVYENILK